MKLYDINFGTVPEETQRNWDNADAAAVIFGQLGPGVFFFSNKNNEEPTALQKLIAFVVMWIEAGDEIAEEAAIRQAGMHSKTVEGGLSVDLVVLIKYDMFEKNEHKTLEEFKQEIQALKEIVFTERESAGSERIWTFDETVAFLKYHNLI